VIRNIVVDIEAGEITSLLPIDLVDHEMRKHKAAGLVLGMRQRIESLGKQVLITDLFGTCMR
jgi:hypothetical protein